MDRIQVDLVESLTGDITQLVTLPITLSCEAVNELHNLVQRSGNGLLFSALGPALKANQIVRLNIDILACIKELGFKIIEENYGDMVFRKNINQVGQVGDENNQKTVSVRLEYSSNGGSWVAFADGDVEACVKTDSKAILGYYNLDQFVQKISKAVIQTPGTEV